VAPQLEHLGINLDMGSFMSSAHHRLGMWTKRPLPSTKTLPEQKKKIPSEARGFTLATRKSERRSADLAQKSVLVYGVPLNVSLLAIRRLLDGSLCGPGLQMSRQPVLGIVRNKELGKQGFIKITCEDANCRNLLFPALEERLNEFGWRAAKCVPRALQRFMRRKARGWDEGSEGAPCFTVPMTELEMEPDQSIGGAESLGEGVVRHTSTRPTKAQMKLRRAKSKSLKLNVCALAASI
jgi:hypothetical protein